MVRDFMVCVDRVIASAACFEHVNGGGSPLADGGAVEVEEDGCSVSRMTGADKRKKGGEMIECRICQEEGYECDMEVPCACNGTIKFAHRKCIQKWCNKKGNITCEICNQIFTPDYSVPPNKPSPELIAIDIRQSWGSRFDIHDSHFLAIAAAEHEFLNAGYEDYTTASASGVSCCRTAVLILMLLFLVRQILNATREVAMIQDISALFNVSLQFAGLFLPCYVMARSCHFMQNRRRR
ncbi:hypothetical protein Cni_G05194 [Canna indica]|uniref:RING-CH-type domain-containing protein n=1 Tax=Canna indica TaxID=4628 RepID=A0AAQ3Q568_9LILI|nr:hypothetical protein Cni_G05194 [Canna indica]